MKKLILILIAIFFYGVTTNAQEQRFIEVVVEEKMEVTPDEVTFSFQLREKTKYEYDVAQATEITIEDNIEETVEAEPEVIPEVVEEMEIEAVEEKPNYSRKNNRTRKRIVISIEEQEESIKEYLKKKGISVESLSSPFSDGNYYGKSYDKSYLLTVKTTELKEVMYSLDTIGARRVRMVSFKNSALDKQKNEMAVMALEKAKKKAEQLVKVYNEKLGSVISISESIGEGNANIDKLLEMVYMELLRKNRTETYGATIAYKVKVKFAIK